MVDVVVPRERARDPWGLAEPAQSRDPERSPMQWDGCPNAGFCPSGVEPWLPLAPDAATVNVAAQRDDPTSMLTLTRRLLSVRREHPVLAGGGLALVDGTPDGTPDGTLVFHRHSEGGRLLVALNLTDSPRQLSIPAAGTVLIGTLSDRDGASVGGTLQLRPNEGVVVEER